MRRLWVLASAAGAAALVLAGRRRAGLPTPALLGAAFTAPRLPDRALREMWSAAQCATGEPAEDEPDGPGHAAGPALPRNRGWLSWACVFVIFAGFVLGGVAVVLREVSLGAAGAAVVLAGMLAGWRVGLMENVETD